MAPKGSAPKTASSGPKAPNWNSLEIFYVKKAQHEVATSNGIIHGSSLREKTGNCYMRFARLLSGQEHSELPWPDKPWGAKGKGAVFTVQDSIALRPLGDLWKQAGKIDTEIKKTHVVAWNDFLNSDGNIPSGKTR